DPRTVGIPSSRWTRCKAEPRARPFAVDVRRRHRDAVESLPAKGVRSARCADETRARSGSRERNAASRAEAFPIAAPIVLTHRKGGVAGLVARARDRLAGNAGGGCTTATGREDDPRARSDERNRQGSQHLRQSHRSAYWLRECEKRAAEQGTPEPAKVACPRD